MITKETQPYNWVAAHSPVIFKYNYEFQQVLAIGVYSGSTVEFIGKVAFIPNTPYTTTPSAGMQVCFQQGVYVGNHIVAGFESGIVILQTVFTVPDYSAQNSYLIVSDHIFKVYAGYEIGEPFALVRPKKLIATFKPEATILRQTDLTVGLTATPKLIIDISGYLTAEFDAHNFQEHDPSDNPGGDFVNVSNYEYDGLGYNTGVFTQYELYCNDLLHFKGNVLNAAIDQDDLNGNYVDTQRALTPEFPTVVFASCITYLSYINSVGVWLDLIENGQSTSAPAWTIDDILNG
jgi:hypothetical protein